MTAREKVIEAEAQIRALFDNKIDGIRCPFCEQVTIFTLERAPDALCCEALADVAKAVVDHIEHGRQMEHLEKILEAVTRHQLN